MLTHPLPDLTSGWNTTKHGTVATEPRKDDEHGAAAVTADGAHGQGHTTLRLYRWHYLSCSLTLPRILTVAVPSSVAAAVDRLASLVAVSAQGAGHLRLTSYILGVRPEDN